MTYASFEKPAVGPIYPPKLAPGDTIALIAPADSLAQGALSDSDSTYNRAVRRLGAMNVEVQLAPELRKWTEQNRDGRLPIQARADDIEWAYSEPGIKGLLPVRGGHHSASVLPHVDWEGVAGENPKLFMGYSDMTTILGTIASIGQVAYHGPVLVNLGTERENPYTTKSVQQALFETGWHDIEPSEKWDDGKKLLPFGPWIKEHPTGQYKIANPSDEEVSGQIHGGNLGTYYLTQGSKFFHQFKADSLLFIEDDAEAGRNSQKEFVRRVASIAMQPNSDLIRGVVIGRFQPGSEIPEGGLPKSVVDDIKDALGDIPMVEGVDFGHTHPKAVFPVGGLARLSAPEGGTPRIQVKL